MLYALIFSFVFFISYFLYHISTDEAIYGGEGLSKFIYYFILITHVVLAGVILPFILYAAYYGLTKSYQQHKKLTRYVWPIWFYVSVSGVIVYFMILPYY